MVKVLHASSRPENIFDIECASTFPVSFKFSMTVVDRQSDKIRWRHACSNTASHVNMWSREGVPSAESVSLPLVACSDAQVAVAFSKF